MYPKIIVSSKSIGEKLIFDKIIDKYMLTYNIYKSCCTFIIKKGEK